MKATFFNVFGNCKNARERTARVRGGRRPHYHFRFTNQWTFTRTTTPSIPTAHDCVGIVFDADFEAFARSTHRPLTPLETDFAWVALAVYLADRFSPRHPYGTNASAFWRRRIHLEIPVSNPDKWRRAGSFLVRALEFLTEDDWTISFQKGRSRFSAESQEHFRVTKSLNVEWTALFSGGLDSLAGALRWLQGTQGVAALISGQTHNRIAVGQQIQVTALRERFPDRIEHIGLSYGVPNKSGLTGFESSQRTRGFIHTALGSLASVMNGGRQLLLFENGFGALNLPCDSAQFGSQNSRGTHPVFLRRMAAFVTEVFSNQFVIANPFTFSTKSQMLTAPGMNSHKDLFQKSFSCDRFPNYMQKAPQCGCCASCLVRRLAFHLAGLRENGQSYSADIFNPRRRLRESEWLAFTKLTIQAAALTNALQSDEPWPLLCSTWPDLLRTELELDVPVFRDTTISLLRRHVAEWQVFSKAVHPASMALAA